MADFLNVSNVLENLELKDSMLAAEFGCGSAVFSIALAKKLSKGRVYALDIQEEKLSAVKAKAAHERTNNILTLLCDLEAPKGSTLHDDLLDVVLITNMLFQVENKNIILQEAQRITKRGGQILVVDWLPPQSGVPFAGKAGPHSPKEGMIKPEELKKMAHTLGFSLKKEFAIGDYHYGLLFTT